VSARRKTALLIAIMFAVELVPAAVTFTHLTDPPSGPQQHHVNVTTTTTLPTRKPHAHVRHRPVRRRAHPRLHPRPARPSLAAVAGLAPLVPILDCIKQHESGAYNEQSHPYDGSGAYQMIPSTWRYWSTAAGHAGYPLPYLAPPRVQDAVVIYTITHGGAHNWDPKYGNDPCTVGLP
jgi:hypothetical protein